jgi:hypothetical protein
MGELDFPGILVSRQSLLDKLLELPRHLRGRCDVVPQNDKSLDDFRAHGVGRPMTATMLTAGCFMMQSSISAGPMR